MPYWFILVAEVLVLEVCCFKVLRLGSQKRPIALRIGTDFSGAGLVRLVCLKCW